MKKREFLKSLLVIPAMAIPGTILLNYPEAKASPGKLWPWQIKIREYLKANGYPNIKLQGWFVTRDRYCKHNDSFPWITLDGGKL